MSLLATTLETSLYITVQRAMGRNSETIDGLLTLGIRVIKVQFMEEGIELEFKQSKTACKTSSPMVDQNFGKKIGGNQSGLGAFKGSICFRASPTSTLTNSVVSMTFWSSVIIVDSDSS